MESLDSHGVNGYTRRMRPARFLMAALLLLACINARAQLTRLVTTSSEGQQANYFSEQFARTTPNGRYVAFASGASNLVPFDTNGCKDVFVKDMLTGQVQRGVCGL